LRADGSLRGHYVAGNLCAGAGFLPIEVSDDRLRGCVEEMEAELASLEEHLKALREQRVIGLIHAFSSDGWNCARPRGACCGASVGWRTGPNATSGRWSNMAIRLNAALQPISLPELKDGAAKPVCRYD